MFNKLHVQGVKMSKNFVELFSLRYSVYSRIVKIVLQEKGITFDTHEVNPFSDNLPSNYTEIHPFKRVPAIRHGDFTLYETIAITQYLDEAFEAPRLQPSDATDRARMRQIIAIIDSYGYIPLVRKVFSQRVFGPAFGEATDESILLAGLDESVQVLAALEKLITNDRFMAASSYSLADSHVIPMMDYFTMAPEGANMLSNYPKLAHWWDHIKERKSTLSTRPVLPSSP